MDNRPFEIEQEYDNRYEGFDYDDVDEKVHDLNETSSDDEDLSSLLIVTDNAERAEEQDTALHANKSSRRRLYDKLLLESTSDHKKLNKTPASYLTATQLVSFHTSILRALQNIPSESTKGSSIPLESLASAMVLSLIPETPDASKSIIQNKVANIIQKIKTLKIQSMISAGMLHCKGKKEQRASAVALQRDLLKVLEVDAPSTAKAYTHDRNDEEPIRNIEHEWIRTFASTVSRIVEESSSNKGGGGGGNAVDAVSNHGTGRGSTQNKRSTMDGISSTMEYFVVKELFHVSRIPVDASLLSSNDAGKKVRKLKLHASETIRYAASVATEAWKYFILHQNE